MFLATVVDQIETECDLDYTTIGLYDRAVRKFSEFIGKPAEDVDLERESLNKFIQHIQSSRSNTTASNYRRGLCRVWNYLTEFHDKPAYEIRRLRRPKSEDTPVIAWSTQDVSAILNASKTLVGTLKIGVEASSFFHAMIWVAYDTGLRPSDIFRITWEQVSLPQRCITLVQNKTGKPHVVFMRDATIAALSDIRLPSRERVFPVTWGCTRRWMEKIFTSAAEYGFVRVAGKNLGTLRKSNATQVYIEHGESAAAESLGHTSGTRIVRKHYIDHRALRKYSVPTNPHDNQKRD